MKSPHLSLKYIVGSQCRLFTTLVVRVKLHALVIVGLGIVQAPRGGGFHVTAGRGHAPGRGNRLQVWGKEGGGGAGGTLMFAQSYVSFLLYFLFALSLLGVLTPVLYLP